MAVEILILSGVRQGERVVLDATNFRAGSSPDCAVFFDPLQDTSTANRSASFRLMEDGWYMVHTTGTILINQRTVSGPTRIRSGDVVRMSECGPDFSFCIVASTASTGTKRSGAATNAPTVSGTVQNFSSKVGLPVDSTVTMTPISPTASAPSSITPP
ncbi:MAG TPA: FHA domain-containing protein, partial [Thermoguttaceae bacterium]